MKKLTTLISVVAMMCAVIAALAFSIWAAVYGDSHYGFYKKEYQKYEVTEDLDMNIDHVMYVTEHMMNYLIGKEENILLKPNLVRSAVSCNNGGRKRAGFLQ